MLCQKIQFPQFREAVVVRNTKIRNHLYFVHWEGSGITSLSSSIGHLQNLQVLNLEWTTKLANLPEEIWDQVSLNELNLCRLFSDHVASSLHWVVDQSPCSCSWPWCAHPWRCNETLLWNGMQHRQFANWIVGHNNDSAPMPSKLWPLVLHNATRAFLPFQYDYIIDLTDTGAIYQLPVDGREPFLEILMNREITPMSSPTQKTKIPQLNANATATVNEVRIIVNSQTRLT